MANMGHEDTRKEGEMEREGEGWWGGDRDGVGRLEQREKYH